MKRFLGLLAFVLIAVASVWLLDTLFRLYEERFLIRRIESGQSVYDMKTLKYNNPGHTITRTKKENEFRILSIGDSFAYGIVKPEHNYAQRIVDHLKQLMPDREFTFVNLGTPSISYPEYISLFRFWSANLEYDAVLFNTYLGNDFTDCNGSMFDVAEQADPKGLELFHGPGTRVPHKFRLRFLDYAFALYHSQGHVEAPAAGPYTGAQHDIEPEKFTEIMGFGARPYRKTILGSFGPALYWLDEFIKEAKTIEEAGKKVFILVSPPAVLFSQEWMQNVQHREGFESGEIDPLLPGAIIRGFAAREELSPELVFDLYPCLARQVALGAKPYYGTDTHWDLSGNEIVGDAAAARLAEVWFGRKPAKPFSQCRVTGQGPESTVDSSGLVDSLAAMADNVRTIKRRVITPLADKHFDNPAQVEAALNALGFSPGRLSGNMETVTPGNGRGVFVSGWVFDPERADSPHYITVWHNGRLKGAGPAGLAREDVKKRFNAPLLSGFTVYSKITDWNVDADQVWLYAISPDGRWGRIVSK